MERLNVQYMWLQKLWCVLLLLGIGASLSAQSEIGKHTLFFYPLHRSYSPPNFGGKRPFNPLPGLGYHYQVKEKWAVQAKFFLRQIDQPGNTVIQGLFTDRNIKIGAQHLWIDKRLQVLIGGYLYVEDRSSEFSFTRRNITRTSFALEKEGGLEFSFGLGYQINSQVRLFIGAAFRYGFIKRIGLSERTSFFFSGDEITEERYSLLQLNPFESLGFGYTF